MTTEAGRFPFYAVRRGRVPGIYKSWEECEHQVNGFRNNEHRGFHDLSEDLAWLRSAGSPPACRSTPHAQPVRRRPSRLLESAFCSLPLCQKISSALMAADNLDSGDGSGDSNPTRVTVADPGTDGRFVYVEDMDLMLMWACSFFQIGSPLFVPQEINTNDECVLFRFTVVLPHNSKCIDLVAHGPLCYEERIARQEVLFTMLDKILGATSYTVHDYNYRILGRLKERLKQSRADEVGRLAAQIRILEKENEELLGQVEMFGRY
ncbi:hypothetical protein Ahy_B08g091130 [Arachis hypogaea]|uniref:Ribonuclease H1 N-terminal domain-containing protein n=1 Tax=Arachis hypogaea TaxID=3818 RepID=A0A444Y1F9_ARAHY|nr:hypothetical protein Ahy_B08g091130 [Arachis hypogaea]